MKTLFDLTEPPAPPYNDYHTDPDWWERRRTDSEINAIVDQQMKIAKAWTIGLWGSLWNWDESAGGICVPAESACFKKEDPDQAVMEFLK